MTAHIPKEIEIEMRAMYARGDCRIRDVAAHFGYTYGRTRKVLAGVQKPKPWRSDDKIVYEQSYYQRVTRVKRKIKRNEKRNEKHRKVIRILEEKGMHEVAERYRKQHDVLG